MRDGQSEGGMVEIGFPAALGELTEPAPVRCGHLDCDRPAQSEADGIPVCSLHGGEGAAAVMGRLSLGPDWAEVEDGTKEVVR